MKTLVLFAIFATLASMPLSAPALGVDMWDVTKIASGYSHEYTWVGTGTCNRPWPEVPPFDCFIPWVGNNDHYSAGAESYLDQTATAVTSGKIIWVFTWKPEYGTPPEYVVVKETASAYWNVGGYGSGSVTSASGWATSSLGGDYTADIYPGMPGTTKYISECIRYVRVKVNRDGSSASFTRKARFFAGANGTISQSGAVSAMCGFWVEFAGGIPPSMIIEDPPDQNDDPTDPVNAGLNPGLGGGQEGGDPVNLATGVHMYLPDADIVVYNPCGPVAAYRRNFLGSRTKTGYASPGLSTGWVDGYDVSVTAATPGSWGDLKLIYPNGAQETLTPELSGGQPTGKLTGNPGAPHFATGTPSATTGQWQSIRVTFKDQTEWTLTPAESNIYRLSKIANRMGRCVSILRDSSKGYRVTSVTNDSNPANTLLTFAYNGSYLASLTDFYGRKIVYSFGPAAGSACLLSLSQTVPCWTPNPPVHTTYGYIAVGGRPHLTSVTVDPSPTGSGTSTQHINYYDKTVDPSVDDFSNGKVKSLVDANGNTREYVYESSAATRVVVKNPSGQTEAERMVNFDPSSGNRRVGITDNDDRYTTIAYTDLRYPSKPTMAVDKNDKKTVFEYDEQGNVKSITNPRGVKTDFTYCYPGGQGCTTSFPLGRLVSIKEGSKPPMTFAYSEPYGLVTEITGPKPGTTDGSTVVTRYTYDTNGEKLGNVLTIDAPGNNAAPRVYTAFNYTTDGTFSQPARLGQPLTAATVADPNNPADPGWLRMIHMRYDAQGNVVSVKDALGDETNYAYNVVSQPVLTVLPATPP